MASAGVMYMDVVRRQPARLEEFLKPLEMSQNAVVIRLGVSYPRLNEIVRGCRSVTPDTARKGQAGGSFLGVNLG